VTDLRGRAGRLQEVEAGDERAQDGRAGAELRSPAADGTKRRLDYPRSWRPIGSFLLGLRDGMG
jgi:hypothetical protein